MFSWSKFWRGHSRCAAVEGNIIEDTLPETNSSHLKMDGWNTTFLLGRPTFRGKMLVLGMVGELYIFSM